MQGCKRFLLLYHEWGRWEEVIVLGSKKRPLDGAGFRDSWLSAFPILLYNNKKTLQGKGRVSRKSRGLLGTLFFIWWILSRRRKIGLKRSESQVLNGQIHPPSKKRGFLDSLTLQGKGFKLLKLGCGRRDLNPHAL
jgi:hypothetical protein